jgi:hypothetical protein
MGDAGIWTVKRNNKANTIDLLKKITLKTDDAGQYHHDNAVKFIYCAKQVAKEMHNPLDKHNGMLKLFDKASNNTNSITTKDTYDWKDILKKSKDEAAARTSRSQSGSVHVPDITTRGDAQDEADGLNTINQAILGVKEGFKQAISDAGGTDALSSVLQEADGQPCSIDDYTLYGLTQALIARANRPKAKHVLTQTLEAINMPFDFRKKIMENVALQKILITKAQSFGIVIDVSLLVLNLEANMEYAQSFDWGREFSVSGQAVRKKYPDYSHKHDQASYDDIVQEYAAADRVHVLCEAPAPNIDQANHVSSLTEQLKVFQRAFEDYEQSAFAADDESSKKRSSKRHKKKESLGRHSSRGRSQSRGRSASNKRIEKVKNKFKL